MLIQHVKLYAKDVQRTLWLIDDKEREQVDIEVGWLKPGKKGV